jgi:hypothetical protein
VQHVAADLHALGDRGKLHPRLVQLVGNLVGPFGAELEELRAGFADLLLARAAMPRYSPRSPSIEACARSSASRSGFRISALLNKCRLSSSSWAMKPSCATALFACASSALICYIDCSMRWASTSRRISCAARRVANMVRWPSMIIRIAITRMRRCADGIRLSERGRVTTTGRHGRPPIQPYEVSGRIG